MLNKLLISTLLIAPLAGCSGNSARSSLLHSPLGPELKALWDAHGGLASWGPFSGATFDYQATGAGPMASAGSISAAAVIRFDPPGLVNWRPGNEPAPESGRAFAATSLTSLFHLPFDLDRPGWKFRRAMVLVPSADKPPVEFEASRPGRGKQMGPFLFKFHETRRGLARVHYYFRGEPPGNGVYRVEFLDYQLIQGVLLATTRKHFRVSAKGYIPQGVQAQPFSPAPKGEASPFWVEKLSNLRFLTSDELQALEERNSQEP